MALHVHALSEGAYKYGAVAYKIALCKPIERQVSRAVADVFRRQRAIVHNELRGERTITRAKVDAALDKAFTATKPHLVRAIHLAAPAFEHGAATMRNQLPKMLSARQKFREAVADPADEEGFTNPLADWFATGDKTADGINNTTGDQVGNAVQQSLDLGDGAAQTATAIDGKFGDYEGQRADTIGTTETSGTFELGQDTTISDAMLQYGVQFEKTWLSESDEDVCDDCASNDDEGWISTEDVFGSGDDLPPAHPNCRCTADFQPLPEQELTDVQQETVKSYLSHDNFTDLLDYYLRKGEGILDDALGRAAVKTIDILDSALEDAKPLVDPIEAWKAAISPEQIGFDLAPKPFQEVFDLKPGDTITDKAYGILATSEKKLKGPYLLPAVKKNPAEAMQLHGLHGVNHGTEYQELAQKFFKTDELSTEQHAKLGKAIAKLPPSLKVERVPIPKDALPSDLTPFEKRVAENLDDAKYLLGAYIQDYPVAAGAPSMSLENLQAALKKLYGDAVKDLHTLGGDPYLSQKDVQTLHAAVDKVAPLVVTANPEAEALSLEQKIADDLAGAKKWVEYFNAGPSDLDEERFQMLTDKFFPGKDFKDVGYSDQSVMLAAIKHVENPPDLERAVKANLEQAAKYLTHLTSETYSMPYDEAHAAGNLFFPGVNYVDDNQVAALKDAVEKWTPTKPVVEPDPFDKAKAAFLKAQAEKLTPFEQFVKDNLANLTKISKFWAGTGDASYPGEAMDKLLPQLGKIKPGFSTDDLANAIDKVAGKAEPGLAAPIPEHFDKFFNDAWDAIKAVSEKAHDDGVTLVPGERRFMERKALYTLVEQRYGQQGLDEYSTTVMELKKELGIPLGEIEPKDVLRRMLDNKSWTDMQPVKEVKPDLAAEVKADPSGAKWLLGVLQKGGWDDDELPLLKSLTSKFFNITDPYKDLDGVVHTPLLQAEVDKLPAGASTLDQKLSPLEQSVKDHLQQAKDLVAYFAGDPGYKELSSEEVQAGFQQFSIGKYGPNMQPDVKAAIDKVESLSKAEPKAVEGPTSIEQKIAANPAAAKFVNDFFAMTDPPTDGQLATYHAATNKLGIDADQLGGAKVKLLVQLGADPAAKLAAEDIVDYYINPDTIKSYSDIIHPLSVLGQHDASLSFAQKLDSILDKLKFVEPSKIAPDAIKVIVPAGSKAIEYEGQILIAKGTTYVAELDANGVLQLIAKEPEAQAPLTFVPKDLTGLKTDLPSFSEIDKWERIDGPKGANPGQWYRNPKDGQEYFVKTMKSEAHGYNEVASNLAYQWAGAKPGIDVAAVRLDKDASGNMVIISKKIDDLHKVVGPGISDATKKEAEKFFAVDALLSHWDVAGIYNMDNILATASGAPVRIETGGAMAFGGTGGVKNSFSVGRAWNDWSGLRDANVNQSAAYVFGHLTDARTSDLLSGLTRLNPADLERLWVANGIPETVYKPWLDTIEWRLGQVPDAVASLRTVEAEAPSWTFKDYAAAHGKMSSADRRAFQQWTGSGYTSISDMLFRNRPSDYARKAIGEIDAAFSRSGRTGEDIVTWRGLNSRDYPTWQDDFKVGEFHVPKGYWACRNAFGEGYGIGADVQVELAVPKGSRFVWVAPFSTSGSHEREVFGNKGIVMRVVSKDLKPADNLHSRPWWLVKAELVSEPI